MRTDVLSCDRCDSKILEQSHSRVRPITIERHVGDGSYETKDVRLCSICWDDLWGWTAGEGGPDRGDMADPVPLEKMAKSVDRHITDLQGIIQQLEDEKPD